MTLKFEDLPTELHHWIYLLLDVQSMCRLYIAYSENRFKLELDRYLDAVVVAGMIIEEAPPRRGSRDEPSTFPGPPRAALDITTDVSSLENVKRILNLNNPELISLTVNCDLAAIVEADIRGLRGNIVAMTFNGPMIVNPMDIPTSIIQLRFRRCQLPLSVDLRHLTNLTHFEIG